MRSKHFILLLLVPFSEIKALFYNSELKVKYSFFTEDTKYLCNVLEDYSNIIILSVLFYLFALSKQDIISRKICLFLFILNSLDIVHLGLMDVPYFIILKLGFAFLIFFLWSKSKQLSNF